MKTNTKLYSVLVPAVLILFLIFVSSTASAAIAQNTPPMMSEEAEKEIDLENVTNSVECTNVTSQILPTSFLVKDSTNNKTVVTALRPKPCPQVEKK